MTKEPFSEAASQRTFPTFDEFWDLIDFDPAICKHSIRDAYNTLAKAHQEEIRTLKFENEKLRARIEKALRKIADEKETSERWKIKTTQKEYHTGRIHAYLDVQEILEGKEAGGK